MNHSKQGLLTATLFILCFNISMASTGIAATGYLDDCCEGEAPTAYDCNDNCYWDNSLVGAGYIALICDFSSGTQAVTAWAVYNYAGYGYENVSFFGTDGGGNNFCCWYDNTADTVLLSWIKGTGYDDYLSHRYNSTKYLDSPGSGPWVAELKGDAGADEIYGSPTTDASIYNATCSAAVADDYMDQLRGNTSADEISGDAGEDWIDGGWGDDELFGEENPDYICGDKGDDLIESGSGADSVYGEDGDDDIKNSQHLDNIYGNDDNDRLCATTTGCGGLDGGSGTDLCYGCSLRGVTCTNCTSTAGACPF